MYQELVFLLDDKSGAEDSDDSNAACDHTAASAFSLGSLGGGSLSLFYSGSLSLFYCGSLGLGSCSSSSLALLTVLVLVAVENYPVVFLNRTCGIVVGANLLSESEGIAGLDACPCVVIGIEACEAVVINDSSLIDEVCNLTGLDLFKSGNEDALSFCDRMAVSYASPPQLVADRRTSSFLKSVFLQ